MCKINGHSIFTYLFQPYNAQKLYTSKARAKEVTKAKEEASEEIINNSDGDEISETASTAKINNKNKKKQTLSSLRIPLESKNIGASVDSSTSLGLNLGG